MNIKERAKVVEAMNTLALSVNAEDYIEWWLMYGVADEDDDFESYAEDDKDFAELMNLFLRMMSAAKKDGGLYVDGVVSAD